MRGAGLDGQTALLFLYESRAKATVKTISTLIACFVAVQTIVFRLRSCAIGMSKSGAPRDAALCSELQQC
jgi:hypothetical protein